MKSSVTRNPLLVITLGIMLAYNSLDLLAWGLVAQDVKVSLNLSDLRLGLLSGFAYALFESVMALPLARWADRGHRALVISISAALSGLMVALIGTAETFAQLLLIRTLVAVGDAGTSPASYSLMAARFTRDERPRAMSLLLLVTAMSGVIGLPVAGWLNQLYGWRATFVVIGLPGLALAGLAWLILRRFEVEPTPAALNSRGKASSGERSGKAVSPSYRAVLASLWSIRSLRFLLIGWVASTFVGAGLSKWEAVFFRRIHGLETGELGLLLGVISFIGLAGIYGGGHLATKYAPSNERLQLKAMAIAFAAHSVLAVCVYAAPDYRIAFFFKALRTISSLMVAAPIVALIQTLVPPNMRTTTIAVYSLITNLVGVGLGPLAVGALSDELQPLLGSEALRYALIASSPVYLLAGWCFWCARRTVMDDAARASAADETQDSGRSADIEEALAQDGSSAVAAAAVQVSAETPGSTECR